MLDYASHGLADEWNGHWQYGPLGWTIVRWSRPYLLNREPHATQQQNLHDAGFEIIEEDRRFDDGGLPRERLAARYQTISDIDLRTRGVFLVGRRPERSQVPLRSRWCLFREPTRRQREEDRDVDRIETEQESALAA